MCKINKIKSNNVDLLILKIINVSLLYLSMYNRLLYNIMTNTRTGNNSSFPENYLKFCYNIFIISCTWWQENKLNVMSIFRNHLMFKF